MYINIGGLTQDRLCNDAGNNDDSCVSTGDTDSFDNLDNEPGDFVKSPTGSDANFECSHAYVRPAVRYSVCSRLVPKRKNAFYLDMRKVQSWHNPSAFYRFEGIQDWYCDHLQRTPPCTHSVSNKSDAPRIELPIDPPELSGHREYWSKLKAFFKQRYVRFLILLLSYVCFLCIGAVCFRFLEQPGEQQVDKLSGEVVDLISNCHCFSSKY
uniref:Ion_trans_2 domain-containing protein n=1 Tax=Mesocestoides corti TaxID=53468 RepID=A0A5K3EQS8_MESCO